MQFSNDRTIHSRTLHHLARDGFHFAVDPARPNWVATNAAGARLLQRLGTPATVADLVQLHTRDGGRRGDVHRFLEDALDAELIAFHPVDDIAYEGRAQRLELQRLEEFWVQINDFCNLSCAHCLVSSSPAGGRGLPDETVRDAVEQAMALGAEMIGITGGEALFRDDLFDLIELILSEPRRSVAVLTNGTRLKGETLERLKRVADERFELRISLDGPRPEVNDPIRGKGSFDSAITGIKNALETDCRVTVTMALNGANARHAGEMPKLLAGLGVSRLHVLWPFQRGRALEEDRGGDLIPSVPELVEGYRAIRDASAAAGISFYTYASWKARIDGAPGLKFDLANHCWSSLCLDTSGKVFPSPALTQHPELALGDIATRSLRELWQNADVARRFRSATLVEREQCRDCHFRFMCGGGDMDHTYNTSRKSDGSHGDLLGDDPYCELYQELMSDAMVDWTAAAVESAGLDPRGATDTDAPRLLRRMGHRPGRPPQQLTAGELTLATLPST